MEHEQENLCNWRLAQSIMNPTDLTLVHESILPLPIFEKSYHRIKGDIQTMTALERLYVRGSKPWQLAKSLIKHQGLLSLPPRGGIG
jgi:hypothetical protein